jgi:hypothetical protein
MLRITDKEREAVVDYFFNSETAYLVELLMNYLSEDFIRSMAKNLTRDEVQDA